MDTVKIKLIDIRNNTDLNMYDYIYDKYDVFIDEEDDIEAEVEISIVDAEYIGMLNFDVLTTDSKILLLQKTISSMAKSIITWQENFNELQEKLEKLEGEEKLKVLIEPEEDIIFE